MVRDCRQARMRLVPELAGAMISRGDLISTRAKGMLAQEARNVISILS